VRILKGYAGNVMLLVVADFVEELLGFTLHGFEAQHRAHVVLIFCIFDCFSYFYLFELLLRFSAH